ncbi:conserved Plasmodium protein, unknown function [Plasmodium gallinaceum]|uniref:Uncharacterized protein n=1 Tax=Plasmodium gallinaceum TaxID=5849 RepID=A0A1J1GP70_PLAGA|nr:conserved Plasmodium protein, unknown function [Plasmodium gallinaceum]CRG94092.1 conserved Plasmodium protein, unknown function [Plasmodium gallinaceum]
MMYLKNKLNMQNITNNHEKMNEPYIYIGNVDTENFLMKTSNKSKLQVKSEDSILNYKNNNIIQNNSYKNIYLLNKNIRKENEFLCKEINSKTQLINENTGNLINLNTKPHICQNMNANCINKNIQLNNSFNNNIAIIKDSKIKVSTQNKYAKNKINVLIKQSNSMKLNRDISEKKNYTIRKFSELYSENSKKEYGQKYFIYNNHSLYKLKNNENTLSNEYENTSIKFPKFFSLNTKQKMDDYSNVIRSSNCEKKNIFNKVDYKIYNKNINDLKNKDNFYLNNPISFIENNKYETCSKNTDNRYNTLQNYIRKKNSLNDIHKENLFIKQNVNSNQTFNNNNSFNDNINNNNEKLIHLKTISLSNILDNKYTNFNKNNNEKINFLHLNKNKKDVHDKKIVKSFSCKYFSLNKSFQSTNSENICKDNSNKLNLKFCNKLNSINKKDNKVILIPLSKNVNYVGETERHDKISNLVRLCSKTKNEDVYLKYNRKNIKQCENKIEKTYENEIGENGENEKKEKYEVKIKGNDKSEIKEICEYEIKDNNENKSILSCIEKIKIDQKNNEKRTKLDEGKLENNKCRLAETDTNNKKIELNSLQNINKTYCAYSINNHNFENSHKKNKAQINNDNINANNINNGVSSMQNNSELRENEKKKKMATKGNIIFKNDLSENHIIELLKILKKVKKIKNNNTNINEFILKEGVYEKIINYIMCNDNENINYSRPEELNIPKDEEKIVDKIFNKNVNYITNSNDYKYKMENYNLNEKMIHKENEFKNDDNNKKLTKNIKENVSSINKNNNLLGQNSKKDSEVTLEFINKVESCLNIIDLTFNELIHLNKIKDIFWYLYIKSRYFQKLSIVDFCEMLKDKIDEKINKNYFMEYVTSENFQNFSKSNFDNFENKMKILENLFHLLKSYPLDYDENKGCFYILHPHKNKMFKNSKYNIIKNKINHLKLTKQVRENFKNSFFFLDKIFIPKDAFFFVKDSEDIGLRDKANKIIYVHQALVNDLKEDINDKSIFENFYSSCPPFKSDYFRYIQKKRIHNKIRKIKEYILYYYEFKSVIDFFEALLEFNHEYKNYEKYNNSFLAFNLTKKIYEKYIKFKKRESNYSMQNTNQNDDNNIIYNKNESNVNFSVVKLSKKNDNNCSINSAGIKRINENNKNENSQFILRRCFSSDMNESNYVNLFLKFKKDKEKDFNEENNSDNNNIYERNESKTLNKNQHDKDIKSSEIFSKKKNFTESSNENNNIIDENSSIYSNFFNMVDTHKKVKEISFEMFKIFIENLGKIKKFPNFTSIDECFLGICFCDPDVPKHIFSQKKILPKKFNFNGFMNCMRYIPYITPDFPIPTCYFSSLYNNADIFNSRSDYINILKYKGKNSIKIQLRNKIILDIIKLFVLISWSFGANTGMFNESVGIPSDKTVDMVDSSYYINYRYCLKKNKINTNNNENSISSNSVSEYFSSSEESTENEKENDTTIKGESDNENNKNFKLKNEEIYNHLNTYKEYETSSKNLKHLYQYNTYNNTHDYNKNEKNDSFEQFFLKKKKKMSYKLIPKWHMCNDIFLSRLVSYDEIQISLQKIFPLFMIQTALIYMIHISCCLLNDEEWKHFFESPFTLYKKLTPEEIAMRYIKLKGYKFYKLSRIKLNKNIDIHHVFMNIPENMQCYEIYKLAINGENTSTGYLAEPFDIYHLMFVSKVFWYIFRYTDNFLILRSTLL